MPNQTLWITKYLDSGLNSDLIKKKACPNPSTNSKVTAVQTCPIWIFFFLNSTELNPEYKYLVVHKIWFGISSQIKKR